MRNQPACTRLRIITTVLEAPDFPGWMEAPPEPACPFLGEAWASNTCSAGLLSAFVKAQTQGIFPKRKNEYFSQSRLTPSLPGAPSLSSLMATPTSGWLRAPLPPLTTRGVPVVCPATQGQMPQGNLGHVNLPSLAGRGVLSNPPALTPLRPCVFSVGARMRSRCQPCSLAASHPATRGTAGKPGLSYGTRGGRLGAWPRIPPAACTPGRGRYGGPAFPKQGAQSLCRIHTASWASQTRAEARRGEWLALGPAQSWRSWESKPGPPAPRPGGAGPGQVGVSGPGVCGTQGDPQAHSTRVCPCPQ